MIPMAGGGYLVIDRRRHVRVVAKSRKEAESVASAMRAAGRAKKGRCKG